MPSGELQLSRKEWAATPDDIQATVLIQPNVNNTKIVSIKTAPGLKGFIKKVAQAWDAAGDNFVKWTLKINGAPYHPNYTASTVQISQPSDDTDLPKYIPVEQLSLVELWADLGGAAVAVNVTGRIQVVYTNP